MAIVMNPDRPVGGLSIIAGPAANGDDAERR
jgi:hypothetical protein